MVETGVGQQVPQSSAHERPTTSSPSLSPNPDIPKAGRGEPLALERAEFHPCCVRHIALLGSAGAGKSWLARELAKSLDLPVIHLDRLYWKPGWVATPDPEWDALQRREVERESWIADGLQEGRISPGIWLDAADTIVFLDFAPLSCMWRVVKRRLDGTPGPEMPADCRPAPFYRALPKFLRFLWVYRTNVRPQVLADLARRKGQQDVEVLRTEDDVRRFLARATAQPDALGESPLM